MKKKNFFRVLLTFCLCCMIAVGACACSFGSWGAGSLGGVTQTEDDSIRSIYDLYVERCAEKGEKPLTYDEWLLSVKGETGPAGPAGPKGDTGNGWHYGDGAPADTLGKDGDLYLDFETYDVYAKESGHWSVHGNIKGGQGGNGPQVSNPYDHTIVFYSSQGSKYQAVTETAIQEFETKYPGWTVDHVQVGSYDDVFDQVKNGLKGGLQPDLAYCYADHVAEYLDSGKVVDMGEYLTDSRSYTYNIDGMGYKVGRIGFSDSDVENFIPNYMEEGKAENFGGYEAAGFTEDSLLTIPFVKSTEVLYYNPDALDALGAEVPTTWDELWDICEMAREKWPLCTPLGYDSEANWFITMAKQQGFGYTSADPNNHYLFNNDGAKQWLTDLADRYDPPQGYFTTFGIYGAYTSNLFVKGPEEGGTVFCIASSASQYMAGNNFTTEVAPIPGVMRDADGDGTPELHAECISQGPSLVMLTGGHGVSNASEKEIMTFQFVKELLDVDFQAKFASVSGYNPMRTDVYDVESYANFLEGKDPETGIPLTGNQLVSAKVAKVEAQLTDRFFTTPAFVGSSKARQEMSDVVVNVVLGRRTPKEALQNAYKNCGGPEGGGASVAEVNIYFPELGNGNAGDCMLLKSGDTEVLIDAGSKRESATAVVSFLKEHCTDGILEYVIVTHAHEDHIAAFVGPTGTNGTKGVFANFKCGTIIDFARKKTTSQISADYITYRDKEVSDDGATHYTALECWNETNGAQRSYTIAEGLSFEILYQKYYEINSSDENNYSVCTLFTHGDNHYLFTGDLELEGEESLVQKNALPHCELFKAGHHGSKTSSNDALLSVIQPEYVCICCCAGSTEYTTTEENTFPTQDAINRIAKYTKNIYVTTLSVDKTTKNYTSMNGLITVWSNGTDITVTGSNNSTILKDTDWFKANRTWPSDGVQ